MISIENLIKSYGRQPVLRGLSVKVHPGEVTLMIGDNGAGKTTTLRVLAGISKADEGRAEINGVDVIHHRHKAQQFLSYLPQGVAFHPRLNCRQVLAFYAKLRRVSRDRIDDMLEQVGLTDHATKRVGNLSGGLRQRLGIGVLFLPDAPVLLLDEPGLSLDPTWRRHLQSMLQAEAERGKTVLVTTHLLGEWEGAANRCLSCRDGVIESETDPTRLRSAFHTTPSVGASSNEPLP